jgi:dTMP kinase
VEMSIFISFEGGDGSGKSTQAKLLFEYLQNNDYDVVLTHEPGGTEYGEQCRRLLLDAPKLKDLRIDKRAEVLGFCSARAQLVADVILPRLKKENTITICDRFADSTIAYQVFGRNLAQKPIIDRESIEFISFRDEVIGVLKFATHNLKPDLTIYLDISLEEGLHRREGRLKFDHMPYQFSEDQQLSFLESNHFDEQTKQFHIAVREGYEWLIENEPERWWRVNAEQSVETIEGLVIDKVMQFLLIQGVHSKSRHSGRSKNQTPKMNKGSSLITLGEMSNSNLDLTV